MFVNQPSPEAKVIFDVCNLIIWPISISWTAPRGTKNTNMLSLLLTYTLSMDILRKYFQVFTKAQTNCDGVQHEVFFVYQYSYSSRLVLKSKNNFLGEWILKTKKGTFIFFWLVS